jgi:hypothetical protein
MVLQKENFINDFVVLRKVPKTFPWPLCKSLTGLPIRLIFLPDPKPSLNKVFKHGKIYRKIVFFWTMADSFGNFFLFHLFSKVLDPG